MKKILHIEDKTIVQAFEERISFGHSSTMADVKSHCGKIFRIIYNDVHKNGYAIMRIPDEGK